MYRHYAYRQTEDGRVSVFKGNKYMCSFEHESTARNFCDRMNESLSHNKVHDQVKDFLEHLLYNLAINVLTLIVLLVVRSGLTETFIHITCQFLLFFTLSVLHMIFHEE